MSGTTERAAIVPAAVAADLREGTELGGYRLDSVIGRGGMGVVYRGEHLHLRRPVAIKLLAPELAADSAFRERFVRESRLAASLHHPNVVTVYDAGEADGLLYIAMQCVEGTDLAELLQGGPLTLERALEVAGQVADALDAAHAKGLVHRDVKPANVLIDESRCYLTDFGLTREMAAQSGLTVRGTFVGTVEYMAPEQIEGRDVGARTDVYSLGCLLYHSLTGAVPYARDSQVSALYAHLQEPPPTLSRERPGLPAALDGVIARALAKKPERRYASCGELVRAARAAAGKHVIASGAPPAAVAAARKVVIAHALPHVRAMIRVSLGDGPFEFREAEDGATAVELSRADPPDLVFFDWCLPDAPAGAIARGLRSDGGAAQSRIVAIAPRSERVDEQALAAIGADALLEWPFSSLQLLYAVAELLGPEVLPG